MFFRLSVNALGNGMPNVKKEAPTASYEVERLCGYRKTVIHEVKNG